MAGGGADGGHFQGLRLVVGRTWLILALGGIIFLLNAVLLTFDG